MFMLSLFVVRFLKISILLTDGVFGLAAVFTRIDGFYHYAGTSPLGTDLITAVACGSSCNADPNCVAYNMWWEASANKRRGYCMLLSVASRTCFHIHANRSYFYSENTPICPQYGVGTWHYSEVTRSCYVIEPYGKDWHPAWVVCTAYCYGSKLLDLTSYEEQLSLQYIERNMSTTSCSKYWLGGGRIPGQPFSWILPFGILLPLTYTLWDVANGEPEMINGWYLGMEARPNQDWTWSDVAVGEWTGVCPICEVQYNPV